MDDALRAELLRRATADQQARRTPIDPTAMEAVDSDNTAWLRSVVDEVGWPGRQVVGEDGADAAWLLVQHADLDPGLQRRCLDLLTAAARDGDARETHVAYLTDRVRRALGGEQEYGTQVVEGAHGWVPAPLRDPKGVDERRASVGLPPLADYLATFAWPDEG